jgi:hypothetical protein
VYTHTQVDVYEEIIRLCVCVCIYIHTHTQVDPYEELIRLRTIDLRERLQVYLSFYHLCVWFFPILFR